MSLTPLFNAPYRTKEVSEGVTVHVFAAGSAPADEPTLRSFGEEWRKFSAFGEEDLRTAGAELFDLLDSVQVPSSANMLDVGCGSGRWTRYLAARVGHVDAVDPSDAIEAAANTHRDLPHVRWSRAWAEQLPFMAGVFDLVLCIGVLHHMADPVAAMREALRVLRPGGIYYVYLYYAMEQRSPAYRLLYRFSDKLRRTIHHLPGPLKRAVCEGIALVVYLPMVSLARLLKAAGWRHWQRLPLAYYHNKRFRLMRNDSLDRFGTPVEKRYTQAQIRGMLEEAGFADIRFSSQAPFWHASARRPAT